MLQWKVKLVSELGGVLEVLHSSWALRWVHLFVVHLCVEGVLPPRGSGSTYGQGKVNRHCRNDKYKNILKEYKVR